MFKPTALAFVVLLAVVAMPGVATANNTVGVTSDAAIGTETSANCPTGCGLEVTMDGSSNNAHVRESDAHSEETIYSAEFLLDMNDLAMTDGDWHFVGTWRREIPSAKNAMRVIVRYRAGQVNPYKIRIVCRNDNNSWTQPGGNSLPPNGSSTIKVEWQQSSGVDTNDGICRFYRNGVLRVEATNLDNDTYTMGSATLGVAQVDAGTSGSQYYDSFVAMRSIEP